MNFDCVVYRLAVLLSCPRPCQPSQWRLYEAMFERVHKVDILLALFAIRTIIANPNACGKPTQTKTVRIDAMISISVLSHAKMAYSHVARRLTSLANASLSTFFPRAFHKRDPLPQRSHLPCQSSTCWCSPALLVDRMYKDIHDILFAPLITL